MEPEVWVIVQDVYGRTCTNPVLAFNGRDTEASHPAFTNEKAALQYMAELPHRSGLRAKKLELREE